MNQKEQLDFIDKTVRAVSLNADIHLLELADTVVFPLFPVGTDISSFSKDDSTDALSKWPTRSAYRELDIKGGDCGGASGIAMSYLIPTNLKYPSPVPCYGVGFIVDELLTREEVESRIGRAAVLLLAKLPDIEQAMKSADEEKERRYQEFLAENPAAKSD